MYLPKEFYIAELAYIDKKLEQLPDVKIGYRGTKKTIRWRDESLEFEWKRINYDHAPSNLRQIADERDYLTKRKVELTKIWQTISKGSYKSIIGNYKLTYKAGLYGREFYEKAKDQVNAYKKEDCIAHKQYFFASRAEYVIATELDRLGLMYKYDVRMPGSNRTVDFLIYVPSLDCCIFLEYFGMMDDSGYQSNTSSKISEYLTMGLKINYDFAILSGDKHKMPTAEEINRTILLCIANLCSERIKQK